NIQKTNITQIINIINNVTSNQTGGGGGGNNQTRPLTVSGYWDTEDGGNAPATISFESDVDGGRTPYNVTWDFGDGQKATNSAGCCRHHTYENPGHYTATVTVTDDSGQTASDSTTVNVGTPSGLSVVLNYGPISGETAPATWTFTVKMYDPISNNRSESDYTYHWDFGDGQTSDSPGRTTTHTYENPGIFRVRVTVTDPEGNTATSDSDLCCRAIVKSASFEVQITKDIQDGTEAPSSWCFEPSIVTGAEGLPPYQYNWQFGDGQYSFDRDVCHTFEQPGDYVVALTVYDAADTVASASTTIRVLPPLGTTPPSTNDTGGNDTGGVTPEPLRAQVNLDSTDIPLTHRFEADALGGTFPYTYHWDFGDGQEANVQNTRHTYENPGTYTATLTVTDATGQTASDNTEVIVQPAAPTTGEPTTTNETAAAEVTPPPATGEGETTAPEQSTTTGGGVVAEEPPPAGTTTTEGEEATTTTTPPASLDTLGQ
ncbi:MAG: PKD domain-containing protein, partial [Nitrososphaera sp.]